MLHAQEGLSFYTSYHSSVFLPYLFDNIISKFCHLFLQNQSILFQFHLPFSKSSKHFKIGLQRHNKNQDQQKVRGESLQKRAYWARVFF